MAMHLMFLKKIWFLLLLCLLVSCSNDPLLSDFLSTEENLSISKTKINVSARNRRIVKVQSDNLPGYKLGQANSPVYGTSKALILSQLLLSRSSPNFGKYSQDKEDKADTDDDVQTINEQETVTEVIFHIPFYSRFKRENRVIQKKGDARLYDLDSIYGDIKASFKLRVEENNYYLGNYDLNDLSKKRIYYSNEDFSSYKGEVITDKSAKIDASEILIYKKDDEKTKDKDESLEVKERISPKMQIQLSKDYFQKKIIDKEGSKELISNTSFRHYMRGVYLSIHDLSASLMLYLDFKKAYIEIKYTYKTLNYGKTEKDTSDDKIEDKEATFRLNVGGHIINILSYDNSTTLPQTGSDNTELIYLNGTQFITEIKLFEGVDLEKLKKKNRLLNEANLIFRVNKNALKGKINNPYRIYLYNLDRSTPLVDITPKIENLKLRKNVYGGTLVEKDDKMYYKIRITNHVNRIFIKDCTNVRLGLMISSNIDDNLTFLQAQDSNNESLKIPRSAMVNPLSTVLYGSSPNVPEEKRLYLELYYTNVEE